MLSCGYTAVTGVSAGSARPLSSNGEALVIGYMAYFPRQLTRTRPRTHASHSGPTACAGGGQTVAGTAAVTTCGIGR